MSLGVIEQNGKFVVIQNGKPINLPKSDGHPLITEFNTKSDAEKYMSILAALQKQKKYKSR